MYELKNKSKHFFDELRVRYLTSSMELSNIETEGNIDFLLEANELYEIMIVQNIL